MKIFVTGGSGYIGRNVVRRLVGEGVPVRALARSATSAAVLTNLGAEPVTGDIAKQAGLADAMRGCSHLVHAAADIDHGGFSDRQMQLNLSGTRNVFGAAHEAGIERAVHLSTEAVLLSGAPLINAREDQPCPARFAGSYSASKAGAEQTALAMSTPGFDVMVVRPRFVWGRDDTTALPQLAEAARSGKLAWIGGGTYRTSTTHIDNAVEGILRALQDGRGGEAYFIADAEIHEFRAFVSALLEKAGVAPPDRTVPRGLLRAMVAAFEPLERASGGRIRSPISRQEFATLGVEITLDTTKARNELGYRPVIAFAEGLETVRPT